MRETGRGADAEGEIGMRTEVGIGGKSGEQGAGGGNLRSNF